MGVVFSVVVAIMITGFLWFWIVRPILEDYGVIAPRAVNDYQETTPVVMSRSDEGAGPYFPPSLQTDGVQTPDQTEIAALRRAKLFDTYRTLRELGMSRDAARAFLKPWNIPVDNNLWAEAAPSADDAPHVTPIVGRATSARFETDADYPYQAPA